MGETSFVNTRNANSVVGDARELDLLFQFDIMDMDGAGSKWDAIPFDLMKFKEIISAWQQAIDWNTLFWGNHDQPRDRVPLWLHGERRAASPQRQDAGRGHVSAAGHAVFVPGRGDRHDKHAL